MSYTPYADKYKEKEGKPKGNQTRESLCGKWENTDYCKCGAKASVYPNKHTGKGYLITELTTPKVWFCEKCYYELIKKDNEQRNKLSCNPNINIKAIIKHLAGNKDINKMEVL